MRVRLERLEAAARLEIPRSYRLVVRCREEKFAGRVEHEGSDPVVVCRTSVGAKASEDTHVQSGQRQYGDWAHEAEETHESMQTQPACGVPDLDRLVSRSRRDKAAYWTRLVVPRCKRLLDGQICQPHPRPTHCDPSKLPDGGVRDVWCKHRNLDDVVVPPQVRLGLARQGVPDPCRLCRLSAQQQERGNRTWSFEQLTSWRPSVLGSTLRTQSACPENVLMQYLPDVSRADPSETYSPAGNLPHPYCPISTRAHDQGVAGHEAGRGD